MKPKFALICLYTDDNKILLQNRKSINKWNSEYGFFGGHIKRNETDLQAVIREAKEEIDINIKKKDLIYLGTVKTPVGTVYTSIFISKLSINPKDINVLEGDGCFLISEYEYSKLKLHPGDAFRIKLIFSYLNLKI